MTAPNERSEPALDRAYIASGGFCSARKHRPYAHACWKIDGKLYCDDCSRKLK